MAPLPVHRIDRSRSRPLEAYLDLHSSSTKPSHAGNELLNIFIPVALFLSVTAQLAQQVGRINNVKMENLGTKSQIMEANTRKQHRYKYCPISRRFQQSSVWYLSGPVEGVAQWVRNFRCAPLLCSLDNSDDHVFRIFPDDPPSRTSMDVHHGLSWCKEISPRRIFPPTLRTIRS
jgi:hypothetical protein